MASSRKQSCDPGSSDSVFQHSSILYALLALVLLRIIAICFSRSLAGDDGERYLRESINLVHFGVFSHSLAVPPLPTAHDLPLFPGMMAVILFATKSVILTEYLVATLNALMYGACAGLTAQLTYTLTKSVQAAFVAAVVMAVSPETLPYSVFFMPESLFTLLFLICICFGLRYWITRNRRDILVAFAFSGACVFAKPILIFYPIILIALVLWVEVPQQKIVNAVVLSLLGVALQLAVLSPWLVRNHRTFGVTGLSSITGYNLFSQNYRYILEEEMGSPEAARAALKSALDQIHRQNPQSLVNPMVESDLLKKAAIRGIVCHPFRYAITTLKRHPRMYLGTGNIALFYLFGVTNVSPNLANSGSNRLFLAVQVIAWMILLTVYALFVRGVYWLYVSRKYFAISLIAVNILYFAAVIGPVTSTRYRFPMVPLFAIAAGAGLLKREASSKRLKTRIIAVP